MITRKGRATSKQVWFWWSTSTTYDIQVKVFTPHGWVGNSPGSHGNMVLTYPVTLTRHRVWIQANAKAADQLFRLRLDLVESDEITVGAGLTGDFDSGSISTVKPAASEFWFIWDCTASGAGAVGRLQQYAEVETY
jgi:hypothetical protein